MGTGQMSVPESKKVKGFPSGRSPIGAESRLIRGAHLTCPRRTMDGRQCATERVVTRDLSQRMERERTGGLACHVR
jgi:hypothetical protein